MQEEQIELVVLLDIATLQNREKFETHVKKEGFLKVEDEEFVYTGTSTTSLFSTKAYILEVFKVALQKAGLEGKAKLIFLLNEITYPAYYYDKTTKEFELVEEVK